MVLPGLIPGTNNGAFAIIQTIISLLFIALIFFFPRIMLWQADRKLKAALVDLDAYRNDAETLFLDKFTDEMDEKFEEKYESMKNFKVSQPVSLDPAGMVEKLENVLDSSEDKFNRFIEDNADTEDEEDLADLNMAFKGVMGTHQIYKVLRHFRILISKTKTIQLVSIVQMMLPIYKEIAESQKEATRAFIDRAPIGDAIGPMVAASLIEGETEEVSEDIIHSEEEIEGQKVHVLKSNGPGARLGKYGDAIDKLANEEELEAVITVDAAAKFEGEETGSVAEGVGVMMGGPGVEKSKIEKAATENDLPLEGIVIKQSPPEASKPMKKEIYSARPEAVDKVKEIVQEFDGPVAVVGVGNTGGAGNNIEELETEETDFKMPTSAREEVEIDDEKHEIRTRSIISDRDGTEIELMLDDEYIRLEEGKSARLGDAALKVEEITPHSDNFLRKETMGEVDLKILKGGPKPRLLKYWDEYEEQEEEDVSHMGMLGVFPGGDQSELRETANSLLWRIPR